MAMVPTASERLTRLLAACARMNVVQVAKEYNIAADVALEAEDRDEQRYALQIARAIHAIGMARFPNTWEAILVQEGEQSHA